MTNPSKKQKFAQPSDSEGIRMSSAAAKSSLSSEGKMAFDATDFDAIVDEMKSYDEHRENVIKKSRDIQKASKQAIFSLHRNDFSEAEKRLETAKKVAEGLVPLISELPTLRGGSYSNAIEEYAEAICFLMYLREGRLPTRAEVGLADNEEWLGGILDFTGELNRFAVARATKRDKKAVSEATDLVNNIFYHMLRLDLRNGGLRRKYDALKYTVKKLEQILYELSLTEAGLAVSPQAEEAPGKATDNQEGDE